MTERILGMAIQGLLALVLILAMTWIVISPSTDEASKAALVIIGSTIGFLFGRTTSFTGGGTNGE